jgi:tetratricopeptide (TPR) repeat protein
MQTLASNLKTPGLSGGKRQELLIRQARLYQLAGNLEEAAKTWEAAAFADSKGRNDRALLEGALCLFALGEFERAETASQMVLSGTKDMENQQRAKYLLAQIEAFQSGDGSSLIELISQAGFDRFKPGIYYTLWKIAGADRYRSRLLAEYPGSPEALMLKNPGAVSLFPSPGWLLFPGRGKLSLGPGAESSGLVQTGLFGREANAQAQADRLKAAGFEARITPRASKDGLSYWAVTVPSGPDVNRTIALLKEKGFDSFPVF